VALTNPVDCGIPFQNTTDPGANPEPVKVRVKPATPAGVEEGLRLVTVGTGIKMERAAAFDTAPLLLTATTQLPGDAMKVSGTVAVNCVGPTKLVDSGAPFHIRIEPALKPDPSTVSRNAELPA